MRFQVTKFGAIMSFSALALGISLSACEPRRRPVRPAPSPGAPSAPAPAPTPDVTVTDQVDAQRERDARLSAWRSERPPIFVYQETESNAGIKATPVCVKTPTQLPEYGDYVSATGKRWSRNWRLKASLADTLHWNPSTTTDPHLARKDLELVNTGGDWYGVAGPAWQTINLPTCFEDQVLAEPKR